MSIINNTSRVLTNNFLRKGNFLESVNIFKDFLLDFKDLASINNDKNLPIIINNFNRLKSLKTLISWVESLHFPKEKKIIILDNNSTYCPLLQYYTQLPPEISVIQLRYNSFTK